MNELSNAESRTEAELEGRRTSIITLQLALQERRQLGITFDRII
jgi:hypothetical protein